MTNGKNKAISKKEETKNSEALAKLREAIDKTDDEILEKIYQRLGYSMQVAEVKQQTDTNIFIPERERDIMQRMLDKNEELVAKKNASTKSDIFGKLSLPSVSVQAIFSEIVSTCRFRMQQAQIGFLGPQGSYSHVAALAVFGAAARVNAHGNLQNLFAALDRDEDIFGIVPLENSSEGIVTSTIDLLANHHVFIVSEHYLPIRHLLLSSEGDLKDIKTVYSHPQALAQCKQWLVEKLPHAILKEKVSTSKAAMDAAAKKNTACIGSKELLTTNPTLNIVCENVQDLSNNTTRFVVVHKRKREVVSEKDITTVIVSVKDRPGALYDVMEVFSKNSINLTNIVSRPSKRKAFDYFFYIEFEGNASIKKYGNALDHIATFVVSLKILGSYSRGIKL